MRRTLPARQFVVACVVAFAAAAGWKCGQPISTKGDVLYSWNDLMLVTGYTAKDTCSCLFVQNQSDSFCLAYTQASPAVASWTADHAKKTVEASALLFWGAKAHYVSPHLGCVLE